MQAIQDCGITRKTVHEGVIYKCDTCDDQFNDKGNLSKHIKSQHQNNAKYLCRLCDYQPTLKDNLSKHNKTVHHADHITKCKM